MNLGASASMEINRIALFLAVVVGAILWIEHDNRTAIEPPAVSEYRPCPDSDAMPYGARCIEFMMGAHVQDAAPVISN
jgi:hypothetical protein